MPDVVGLLLAIVSAYACALAAPLLRRFGQFGKLFAYCCAAAALACPLLVPAHNIQLRAVVCFVSVDLMSKIVDALRYPGLNVREYCRFLMPLPLPLLLVVFADRQRRLLAPVPIGPEAARILKGVAVVATVLTLLVVLSDNATLRASFPLDHAVKVVLFVLSVEAGSRMLLGLERLAGFDTRPLIDSAYRSRSVGEFWSRYNTRMHNWLHHNVFVPAGGRRAPVRGILLVFFVSAVLHELAFGIATSRFDGYQFAFFMLQAPAVLASGGLEFLARRGGILGRVSAHVLTIAWMSVTSVLFFYGMNKVIPWVYASESWLP